MQAAQIAMEEAKPNASTFQSAVMQLKVNGSATLDKIKVAED